MTHVVSDGPFIDRDPDRTNNVITFCILSELSHSADNFDILSEAGSPARNFEIIGEVSHSLSSGRVLCMRHAASSILSMF